VYFRLKTNVLFIDSMGSCLNNHVIVWVGTPDYMEWHYLRTIIVSVELFGSLSTPLC